MFDRKLYERWYMIKSRYEVCEEWQEYKNFAEWMYENGYTAGIKKNLIRVNRQEPFSPKNCRLGGAERVYKMRNRYYSYIIVNGRQWFCESGKTPAEAISNRNRELKGMGAINDKRKF